MGSLEHAGWPDSVCATFYTASIGPEAPKGPADGASLPVRALRAENTGPAGVPTQKGHAARVFERYPPAAKKEVAPAVRRHPRVRRRWLPWGAERPSAALSGNVLPGWNSGDRRVDGDLWPYPGQPLVSAVVYRKPVGSLSLIP